jgi:hypothetical protein
MNRHERRRQAALNRRTGYQHRMIAAFASGAVSATPGIHVATVEHDPDCSIYRGGGCDCVPDISISLNGTVLVIDERGQVGRKTRVC